MRDLPRTYRYQYRMWLFAGHWKHSYELIGRWGGIHFHVTDFADNPHASERYSAGLEIHYRQPPPYMDGPPSHDECFLLKAPCWHDGTSLYAQERILPLFNGRDHDTLFRFLAGEADERFSEFAIVERAAHRLINAEDPS